MIFRPKNPVEAQAIDVYMLGVVLFRLLFKTYP